MNFNDYTWINDISRMLGLKADRAERAYKNLLKDGRLTANDIYEEEFLLPTGSKGTRRYIKNDKKEILYNVLKEKADREFKVRSTNNSSSAICNDTCEINTTKIVSTNDENELQNDTSIELAEDFSQDILETLNKPISELSMMDCFKIVSTLLNKNKVNTSSSNNITVSTNNSNFVANSVKDFINTDVSDKEHRDELKRVVLSQIEKDDEEDTSSEAILEEDMNEPSKEELEKTAQLVNIEDQNPFLKVPEENELDLTLQDKKYPNENTEAFMSRMFDELDESNMRIQKLAEQNYKHNLEKKNTKNITAESNSNIIESPLDKNENLNVDNTSKKESSLEEFFNF